jgi:diguanylate cyclase (GGDEF)-like protein
MNSSAILGQRYEAVFRMMLGAALAAYAGYLLLFLALDVPWMPVVNAAAIALLGGSWWLLAHGRLFAALAVTGVVVLLHSLIATSQLGWGANFHLFGFVVLVFSLLCPDFNRRTKFAIFVVLTLAYLSFEASWHTHVPAEASYTGVFFKDLNTVVFCAILGFLAHTYAATVSRTTLELETMNNELARLARTDALTGLLNRRCLHELIEAEIARFKRNPRPFAVILGDIDDFKAVNDRHGHQAGDVALRSTAKALRESVRDPDSVARWGGEEFLVLLPETGLNEAAGVARRIQGRLRHSPVPYAGARIEIRMTFGIAEYRDGETVDALLADADRRLYNGKQTGKDRVVAEG